MKNDRSFPVFTLAIIAMLLSFMAIYLQIVVRHAYTISVYKAETAKPL